MQLEDTWTISIVLIVMAEFIDRCEFYEGLKVITPEKQIRMDLKSMVDKV
jgi:hypothetical protein